MAIINYTDQLKYAGKGYLDAKMMPVKTYEDLKTIPSTQRFEGLTIVVLNDGNPQDYWLVGGISNSCWKPKTSTNFNDLYLSLEEGFLKLKNSDVQLGEAIDLNNFFPVSAEDIFIETVDYTTSDENGHTGIFMCFTYSNGTKKYLNMSQFLANTYEAGAGIVIDGNVISLDAALLGKIEIIENALNELQAQLASKADITDVEALEEALTDVSKSLIAEKEMRETADLEHTNQIDSLRNKLANLTTTIESNRSNIESNTAAIAVLKTRVDALSSNTEGSTPDGETIGITDDEKKALYVKILNKEGNILTVDSENGMTGLYAGLSFFCEDEELNEE